MTLIETLSDVPDGYRVTIQLDGDAENPRDMNDDPVGVLSVPDGYYGAVAGAGPWEAQWRKLLARHDWERAIEVVTRWARANGHHVYDHAPHRGVRSLWYLTREDAADWTDPDAALEAYAKEYQAWADGDVYGYVIEREATWQRVDGPERGERRTTWETIESVWGFYGPSTKDVESEARAALAAILTDQ